MHMHLLQFVRPFYQSRPLQSLVPLPHSRARKIAVEARSPWQPAAWWVAACWAQTMWTWWQNSLGYRWRSWTCREGRTTCIQVWNNNRGIITQWLNSLSRGDDIADECRKAPLMVSWQWFRWWLGDIRHQAITWAHVAPDLCRHMVSLRHNELMQRVSGIITIVIHYRCLPH